MKPRHTKPRIRTSPAGGRPVLGSLRAGRKSTMSADDIYERILGAIFERRLPPGTQLVEERLAGVFGVSRTKVRQAIGRLAHDCIVTLYANRGAFVSRPSVADAREVFAARRVIEPELIRELARAASAGQVARLRAHVAKESAAHRGQDRRGLITLSGEFHLLVAEMAGNGVLTRTMRELESLTCLAIITYDTPSTTLCPHEEHAGLVDAIEARDPDRAAAAMRAHLHHVETALDLTEHRPPEIAFEEIFA